MRRTDDHIVLHKVATFLINVRYGIISLFVLITIGMGISMMNLHMFLSAYH